jgi:DNA polymerase-1
MIDVRVTGAAKRVKGRLMAAVEAYEPPGNVTTTADLLHADTIDLGSAKARTGFAQAACDRAHDSTLPAALEPLLLALYQTADQQTPQAADDDSGGRAAKESVQIVQMLSGPVAEFFHTGAGLPYVTVDAGQHKATFLVTEAGFREWVSRKFYLDNGAVPTGQAVHDALGSLAAKAKWEGPEREVYLRVAPAEHGIYLDLGDASWDGLEVTATGWRVVSQPVVKFRRPKGMLALPRPASGGTLDDLRRFVRLAPGEAYESELQKVLGFLLDCYRPGGPYGILALHGPEGSGKSTLSRVLNALVDPRRPPTRRPPRDERTLFIGANNSALLIFCNLSGMPGWFSDALCSITSGEGQAERLLHSDADEQLFDVCRPVILNAIEEVGTRADLLDRYISVQVPKMAKGGYGQEQRFWTAFERARPKLLGLLLDAVSGALAAGDDVDLGDLPRLADSAHWAGRALAHLGYDAKEVVAQFHSERDRRHSRVLESSTLAAVLETFVRAQVGERWEGLVGDLLAELNVHRGGQRPPKDWPADATRLAGQLRRLESAFSTVGLQIEFPQRSNRGQRVVLAIGPPPAPPPPGTHADAEQSAETATPATLATLSNAGEGSDSVAESVADGVASYTVRSADRGATNGVADSVASPSPATLSATPREPLPALESVAGVAAVAVSASTSAPALAAAPVPAYVYVDGFGQAVELLPELMAEHVLGLDTETTGLNPRRDTISLLQLATAARVYVFDVRANPRESLHLFYELFSEPKGPVLVGHNLAFDLSMLGAAGVPCPPSTRLVDTMLLAQLLRAGTPEFYHCGLADEAARTLGWTLDKTFQKVGWAGTLTDAQLAYAATDAAVLLPLMQSLLSEVRTAGLERVWTIERDCLPAMLWLDATGAPFDAGAWQTLSDAAVRAAITLTQELNRAAGLAEQLGLDGPANGTLNWDSPAQVRALLAQRGHPLPAQADGKPASVDDAALLALEATEPIAVLLRRYRDAQKRTGTYGLGWLQHVTPAGRIHADYRQLGSIAGRMACTRPNMQNLPREKAYRACVRAPEGRTLIKADYSQIELRIAAEIAGDVRMQAAYQQGADLHTLTAASVLGRANGAVRPEDRQAAKALNFGLVYGMGAATLREHAAAGYGVALTTQQAQRYRADFFRTYRELAAWHREQPKAPVDTRTLAGRRRVHVQHFTEKLNSPVQGTGADGLKQALGLLYQRRAECPSAVPVLCVHDELVIECDADAAEPAQRWLTAAMVDGMQPLLPEVPVVVEAQIGRDWSMKG